MNKPKDIVFYISNSQYYRPAGAFPRLRKMGVRHAPLNEAEPPRYKQWFGIFTIPQPQERVSTLPDN